MKPWEVSKIKLFFKAIEELWVQRNLKITKLQGGKSLLGEQKASWWNRASNLPKRGSPCPGEEKVAKLSQNSGWFMDLNSETPETLGFYFPPK